MKIVLIVTNSSEFLGYYRMFIMLMKSMKKAKKNQLSYLVTKGMNNMINKFFLAGKSAIPEVHLKEPEVICIECGPFTKNG